MCPIDDGVLRAAFGPAAPARAEAPWERWARAVLLGARGRYAAAETLLHGLRTDPGVPSVLRAHAAVTRASHLRQVGAHDAAHRFDAAAVQLVAPAAPRLARPVPDPGSVHAPGSVHGRPVRADPGDERSARAADVCGRGAAAALGDALTGLAADAVGRWDPASAERLLRRAAPWCGVHPGRPADVRPGAGRPAVRWHWVRAETSLLSGDPDGAVRAARTACVLADDVASARHRLKSRLVHAVARAVAGGPSGTVAELDVLADEAAAAGLPTLRWPALLAAADADGDATGPRNPQVGEPDEIRPNERHAGPSRPLTGCRQAVAESRRHAAMLTLNVIYLHSDPVARRAMRESAWLPGRGAVPY